MALEPKDVQQQDNALSLTNRKRDREGQRDPVQEKGGCCTPDQGGHHLPEDVAKSHGVQDFVHIGQADPIIGTIDIQIHEKALSASLSDKFRSRPERNGP
jgi:hypothetical protein